MNETSVSELKIPFGVIIRLYCFKKTQQNLHSLYMECWTCLLDELFKHVFVNVGIYPHLQKKHG